MVTDCKNVSVNCKATWIKQFAKSVPTFKTYYAKDDSALCQNNTYLPRKDWGLNNDADSISS